MSVLRGLRLVWTWCACFVLMAGSASRAFAIEQMPFDIAVMVAGGAGEADYEVIARRGDSLPLGHTLQFYPSVSGQTIHRTSLYVGFGNGFGFRKLPAAEVKGACEFKVAPAADPEDFFSTPTQLNVTVLRNGSVRLSAETEFTSCRDSLDNIFWINEALVDIPWLQDIPFIILDYSDGLSTELLWVILFVFAVLVCSCTEQQAEENPSVPAEASTDDPSNTPTVQHSGEVEEIEGEDDNLQPNPSAHEIDNAVPVDDKAEAAKDVLKSAAATPLVPSTLLSDSEPASDAEDSQLSAPADAVSGPSDEAPEPTEDVTTAPTDVAAPDTKIATDGGVVAPANALEQSEAAPQATDASAVADVPIDSEAAQTQSSAEGNDTDGVNAANTAGAGDSTLIAAPKTASFVQRFRNFLLTLARGPSTRGVAFIVLLFIVIQRIRS